MWGVLFVGQLLGSPSDLGKSRKVALGGMTCDELNPLWLLALILRVVLLSANT